MSRVAPFPIMLMLAACAGCQSVPPDIPPLETPREPEPVLERPVPDEQLEQVFEGETAPSDQTRYVMSRDSAPTETAVRSPKPVARAQRAPQRAAAAPRRANPSATPAVMPTPYEETHLLPRAPLRPEGGARKGEPLMVGAAVPVDLNPYAGGTWINEGSDRFWVLRLKSVGASSLSLYFNPLRLPPGSALTIADAAGSIRHGPYTAADLQGRQEFWTPGVPGDTAVVRLKLPPGSQSGLMLNLAQARIGYRAE